MCDARHMRLALILLTVGCTLALPRQPASGQVAPASVAALSPSPDAACGLALSQPEDPDTYEDNERLASSKNPCAVADNNLAREEAEILKPKPPAAAAPRVVWDHKSRPQFLGA